MKAFWITDEKEKPLDTLVKDGGFCGIFRRIGCVGDSLSSGEYEFVNEDGTKSYYDLYDLIKIQFFPIHIIHKALNRQNLIVNDQKIHPAPPLEFL